MKVNPTKIKLGLAFAISWLDHKITRTPWHQRRYAVRVWLKYASEETGHPQRWVEQTFSDVRKIWNEQETNRLLSESR